MKRPYRGRHNLTVLRTKPLSEMTKGERIAATKAGIHPGIRNQRERQLRHRYGLTLEDYAVLLEKQNNQCAICGRSKWKQAFYVDHEHGSGRVRGLLCAGCNTLVGVLERRRNLLDGAEVYLMDGLSINDIITVLGEAQEGLEIDAATFVALLTRFNRAISARPVPEKQPLTRNRQSGSQLVPPPSESPPTRSDAVDRMEAIEVIPYPPTDDEAPLGKLAKGAPVGGYAPRDITPPEEA